MTAPRFLVLEDVLFLHEQVLMPELGGGAEGVRDLGVLQGAIAAAEFAFFEEEEAPGLFELAAIYAERLIQDRPFVDANARTGIAAAMVFLQLNAVELQNDDSALERLASGITSRELGRRAIARALKSLRG